MQDKYINQIAQDLSIKGEQVQSVVGLLEGGATIPFIARYRKEMTGMLDELQIESIFLAKNKFEELEKRKKYILSVIDEQGKLTSELCSSIESCNELTLLEDIYLPFKSSRKTKADKARALGLEGLAKQLMSQHESQPDLLVHKYIKGNVKNKEEAYAGARDIMAEWIGQNPWTRDQVRKLYKKSAQIKSHLVKAKEAEAEKYQSYFDWSEPLKKCPSHRYLAMTRGEKEGLLRVVLEVDQEALFDVLKGRWVKSFNLSSKQVEMAVEDAFKRLIKPAIETEVRGEVKQKSDTDAIKVFANNLRQLLLQPPVGEKRVLAIDPGFKSGCKVVCLDERGTLLHNETIFPHPPQKQSAAGMSKISGLVQSYKIEVIAIGNGTAGRETEQLIKRIKFDRKVQVYVVDESGASIYSASSVGRAEFPTYDVTVRGAVSIGRRLMDPLSELVKIDPKSIGVGQYQHDVDQKSLAETLSRTVESVVNSVGVNVNTASPYLLRYVSGLGPALADNIVQFRKENGKILSRSELKKVAKLGPKAFEQCAGFLRVKGGNQRLDDSAVHPESYHIVKSICKHEKLELEEAIGNKDVLEAIAIDKYISADIGLPTLIDIVDELKKPGQDPRQYVGLLEFDQSISVISDLKEGMELPGLVTNVTNFGAFVDIGIKENGLVHISELKDDYVSNPADVVKVYDKVRVKVKSLDLERKRIQLSMKGLNN